MYAAAQLTGRSSDVVTPSCFSVMLMARAVTGPFIDWRREDVEDIML